VAGAWDGAERALGALYAGALRRITWADVDFDAALIRVHRQLDRRRRHAPLKTEAAKREVILASAHAAALRQHFLASHHKGPTDFVFLDTRGRALDYRRVGKGFRRAVNAAGLHAPAG
jgi:integrase